MTGVTVSYIDGTFLVHALFNTKEVCSRAWYVTTPYVRTQWFTDEC